MIAKTEKYRIALLDTLRIERLYKTALYFETMPEYDPVYKYCYSISNMRIPYQEQSVNAWLQAVSQHLHMRRPGHGGEENHNIVVEIPILNSEKAIDNWLAWISADLKKHAMKRKTRKV